jgi:hypothetical protein
LSDYNVPQRFAASVIYSLPFHGNLLTDGWRVAAIVQAQAETPSTLSPRARSQGDRYDSAQGDGANRNLGSPDRWFDTSVFTPTADSESRPQCRHRTGFQ